MALPLFAIAIGTALGVKGPALIAKIKGLFSQKAEELSLSLDANLPKALERDAINILSHVSSPALLRQALAFYQGAGYPVTASLISQKISHLFSKG